MSLCRSALCVLLAGLALAAPTRALSADDAAARAAQAWNTQDFEGAASAYAEVVAEKDADMQAWYRLGYALHALGRPAEAAPAHERAAVDGSPFAATAGYNAACARALLGQTDAAFVALERALANGFNNQQLLATDTDLAKLRADPRFAELWAGLTSAAAPSAEVVARTRRDFDPWLGEWDAQPRVLDANGAFVDGGWLKVRVESALDGHLILEYSEGSIAPGTALTTVGYSMRAVDPNTGRWEMMLNWPSPGTASFGRLGGVWRHHRGEMFSPLAANAQGGSQTRFTFSDVAPDHMRWDGASTQDGGKSWAPNLIFEKTRRPPEAKPLWNGASRNNDWGNTPEFRALDFAIGTWTGTRSSDRGAPLDVERRLRSVIEGTMIEEFVTLNGSAQEYSIRGHVPQSDDWSEYSVTRRDTTLLKAAGSVSESSAVFTTPWQSPERPESRTTLERDDDGLNVTREWLTADGTWVVQWREALKLKTRR